jgi:hypothetical protein
MPRWLNAKTLLTMFRPHQHGANTNDSMLMHNVVQQNNRFDANHLEPVMHSVGVANE